ncbi:MAG: RhuM family protein [Paracoccus sp. (in: a-proteobacteria)]|uniref:RhuM family protein n=1 Tax=Paracoccus sp. TaxID=267 RepID=UPI0026DEECA1|nr:RhuM family protein [Paracoccus sp. (in: a-proteobacteria)]MDO5632198.1 RhuM family protein [Paracoccus sp. (in: a-proteobacteria)]
MNDDDENTPVHLVEDERTGDRFLVYSTDKGLRLDIRFEGETLWMSQAQIGELFGRDVSTISRHIGNVLEDGELDESSSLQKMQTTNGRPATLYSLDMVISVGYRVSSAQATIFRRWATGVLVQYAKKGFVVDAPRLKQAGNLDRIRELREIIRDIRSDEANLYAELQRICSLCQDYDGKQETGQRFFRYMQAKMVYAVVSQTPSEVVRSRADHRAANMGLVSWPNDNIRKADVTISKNYLSETEIRELNRLTDILLTVFEDQLDLGRLVVMDDAKRLMDNQLLGLGRTVLRDGGTVQRRNADAHAVREYERFDALRKTARKLAADERIATSKAARTKPKDK